MTTADRLSGHRLQDALRSASDAVDSPMLCQVKSDLQRPKAYIPIVNGTMTGTSFFGSSAKSMRAHPSSCALMGMHDLARRGSASHAMLTITVTIAVNIVTPYSLPLRKKTIAKILRQ